MLFAFASAWASSQVRTPRPHEGCSWRGRGVPVRKEQVGVESPTTRCAAPAPPCQLHALVSPPPPHPLSLSEACLLCPVLSPLLTQIRMVHRSMSCNRGVALLPGPRAAAAPCCRQRGAASQQVFAAKVKRVNGFSKLA